MAIYQYDSSIGETPPIIINGPPPADQSALIATLTAELAIKDAKIVAMQKAIDDAQLNLGPF